MSKILCFGSINIDNVYRVEHIVKSGETIIGLSIEKHCGGKGLNQAIALGKAGANVYMAGGVGNDDSIGTLDILNKSGVDISLVESRNVPNGNSIIQVDPIGNNSIIIYGGANQKNTEDYVIKVLNHFHEDDWLILQNEINGNELIISEAKKRKMKICLNPSPFSAEVAKLCNVDILFVNEIEAENLCHKKECDEQLSLLHSMFKQTLVIITLGENGSVAIDTLGRKFTQVPYKCSSVDTTGAGDTFTGYFLAEYVKNKDIIKALDLASAASSLSVRKMGAAESIPTLQETENFIEQNSVNTIA